MLRRLVHPTRAINSVRRLKCAVVLNATDTDLARSNLTNEPIDASSTVGDDPSTAVTKSHLLPIGQEDLDDAKQIQGARPNPETVGSRETAQTRIREEALDDQDFNLDLPNALHKCTEDVSYLLPKRDPPKTFAYVADKSMLVQRLIRYNVKLYQIENDPELFSKVIGIDYESSVKPLIRFLHDCGLDDTQIGTAINHVPRILITPLEDLKACVIYLEARGFTKPMITNVMTTAPNIVLDQPTKLDHKIGYLQWTYGLTSTQVTALVSSHPRIATTNLYHLEDIKIILGDEFKLSPWQISHLLLHKPSIWSRAPNQLRLTMEYAEKSMKLTTTDIVANPAILTCKLHKLKARHEFLVLLGNAQYNPKLPCYVSPTKLVAGSNEQFSTEVAEVDYDLYCTFLKTF